MHGGEIEASSDWKRYELRVYEALQSHYPNASFVYNAKVLGGITHIHRQIDVLIEVEVMDTPIRIIVDAKKRTSKIDVNDVESFISMMADVQAHRGLLISTSGYTKTALARAHNEINQDIDLDILTLDELKEFQGEAALPFSGGFGVFLSAPFGWVIDAQRRKGAVAYLYQRGFDFEAAGKAKELMYLNFWRKESPDQNLADLLAIQAARTLLDAEITYLPSVTRSDAKTAIRFALVPRYPNPEYTGFVEFDKFIFFVVLFTSPETSKRNLRKLREILRTVLPIQVNQSQLNI